jgi:tetratricopeptide (TPR) repeat protein
VFLLALDNGTYDLSGRSSLAVGLWWAVAVAVGVRLWPRERSIPATAYVAAGALALFALLTALSISWTDSAEKGFNEVDRVLLYLGVFALVALAARRGSAARWSDGLALGIVAVGLLALVSELFPSFVGPGAPPSFFPSEDRLSYPVNYWNGLAVLVGIGFPLLLRAAVASRQAIVRALALAPIPALTAVIYLTSSRGGAATALCGVVVFLALTSPRIPAFGATLVAVAGSAAAVVVLAARHELVDGPIGSSAAASQGRSAAVLLVIVCAGTALAYWAWCRVVEPRLPNVLRGTQRLLAIAMLGIVTVAGIAAVHPVQKFNDFKAPPVEQKLAENDFTKAHLLSANGSGRWQIWASAVDEWKQHPIAGDGSGSFQAWWAAHGTLTKFVRDAHSLYLETLGELGLLGLALLVVTLGSGFVAAGRRLRRATGERRATIAALAAALAAFMLAAGIDWMWELTIVGVIGIACLALLTGSATEEERPSDGPGSSRKTALRAAVVAVCLVAISLEGLALLSQARLDESQSAAKRGDAGAALSAADEAHTLEPWASSPYLQLALLEEQSGDLRAARTRIGEALDRDPSDWRLWLVSARLDVKAGFIGEARRSLAHARALNPRSPLFATNKD